MTNGFDHPGIRSRLASMLANPVVLLHRAHQLSSFKPIVRARLFHIDRKSTRLNSSHGYISYAVFCLKKKKKTKRRTLVEKQAHEGDVVINHRFADQPHVSHGRHSV